MSNEQKDTKQESDKSNQPAKPPETESTEQDKKPKPGGGAEERNVGG